MRWNTLAPAARILLACVAVVLPAGVVSATVVDRRPPASVVAARDGRVGAAGLNHVGLLDGGTTVSATVSVTPSAAPVTSTPGSAGVAASTPGLPPVTATTIRPASPSPSLTSPAPRTSPTLPPGAPVPAMPPFTGIPNIAPTSSWQRSGQGINAGMRLDSAVAVAGQPVRFLFDVSSAEACCTIMLDFGDASEEWIFNSGRICSEASPFSPGAHSAGVTHAYARAGAYKAHVTVLSGDYCDQRSVPPGGTPPVPGMHAVSFDACVGVGPGTSRDAGCSPFPNFGPNDLVSPVIDPLCQIRSDCTQASKPR